LEISPIELMVINREASSSCTVSILTCTLLFFENFKIILILDLKIWNLINIIQSKKINYEKKNP